MTKTSTRPPGKRICLLSLDGGGVRGLSSLHILNHLMELMDPENPPKPCEVFDLIGGTSTGGLIAIMLGRLRMSVSECIAEYKRMSPKIFTKLHHRITLKGNVQGRFDSEGLREAVQQLLESKNIDRDALLKEPAGAMPVCKTFVCATSQNTSETVVLSSYFSRRRGTSLLNVAKIWEAARATSAASSFFDPISIGDEGFVDGAAGANNPINEMWTEARDIWREGQNWVLEDNLHCLVSIGTGMPTMTAFGNDPINIGKSLVAVALNTERKHEIFQQHHSSLFHDAQPRAFRFNVIHGLENIGLEETEKQGAILAATRRYNQAEDVFNRMEMCAQALCERDCTFAANQQFANSNSYAGQPSKSGAERLCEAVQSGDVKGVKTMLSSCADVSNLLTPVACFDNPWYTGRWMDYWGIAEIGRTVTALHCAVEAAGDNSLEILRMVLQVVPRQLVNLVGYISIVDALNNCRRRGGRPTLAPDHNGGHRQRCTVLTWAAILGNAEAVSLLIQAEADINSRENWLRVTPLIAQCFLTMRTDRAMVVTTLLLEAGALLDLQDDRGNTALHLALFINNSNIALALLNAGASVDLANYDGHQASDYCMIFDAPREVQSAIQARRSRGWF